ncbi:MAG: hypothetical protein KF814_16995 [Nitrospiraceae bacterium]|nr:hypothetical protein [Nitrospiraceae bacterium]
MKHLQLPSAILLSLSVLMLGACATEEAAMTGGSSASGAAAGSAVKSAQAPDALQACLSRIPSGSSAGTRMVAEESCKRDEALRQAVVGTASAKSGDRSASGTQGDSLEACTARIPKDASAGQRMLAIESCKRDQANQR